MKITETIERECCIYTDMCKYQGTFCNEEAKNWGRNVTPMFCIHCGQLWIHTRKMGPAGSMENELEKLDLNPFD